jgi:hypothetical protein
MSPVLPAPRLDTEAVRALVGVWLVIVSLAGAQPLYRWLGANFPAYPSLSLACALFLALTACAGMALVAVAGFRALTTLIAHTGQRATAGS